MGSDLDMTNCILCGRQTPSDEDNTCYKCLDWFIEQDRQDMMTKWPSWLRELEIKVSLNAVNNYLKSNPSLRRKLRFRVWLIRDKILDKIGQRQYQNLKPLA